MRTSAVLSIVAAAALAAAQTNPPAYSGKELFAANCANCHGRAGEGGGPAAVDLPHAAPDLRRLSSRNGGTFPRDRVAEIIDGRVALAAHVGRSMPVWGDAFQDIDTDATTAAEGQMRAKEKIDALVDFLASIQQP